MAQVIRKSNRSAWQRIKQLGKDLQGTELKIGWFETAKYPDGTPVAYVATIHEFGYPEGGIPPRPFMRPTIEREEDRWRTFLNQESVKVLLGVTTVSNMFESLGLSASGEVARSIRNVTEPALKPATIVAKRRKMAARGVTGSLDKPLVETSLMIDSVTHTVDK